MTVTLTHPNGLVRVEQLANGRRKISVSLRDANAFIPTVTWETAYPLRLIERLTQVKGPAYLCHEIIRDEDPKQIRHQFEYDLLSYVAPEDFAGKRILDFACGCGASSMVLLRMFPQAEVVGIDLKPDCLAVAREIAEYYCFDRATFFPSPDRMHLPAEMGEFDYIVMSAVYEHLLPDERRALLPQLWAHLEPRGVLFVNQTPHRFFPVELHTTRLPLINYLPAPVVLPLAHRFSRRVRPGETWDALLRRGIRGGTPREILGILRGEPGRPLLLEPRRSGIADHIDLWYRWSSGLRSSRQKEVWRCCMKGFKRLTGIALVPGLALAIEKSA